MTQNKDDNVPIMSLKSSTREKKLLSGSALKGRNVMTNYGRGIVLEYRHDTDQIYVVELTPFGTGTKLQDEESTDQKKKASSSSQNLLYTPICPVHIKTQKEYIDELNAAYQAMEKMRRLNLETEYFDKHGVVLTTIEGCDSCTACLLSDHHNPRAHEAAMASAKAKAEGGVPVNRFPRLQNFVDTAKATADSASAKANVAIKSASVTASTVIESASTRASNAAKTAGRQSHDSQSTESTNNSASSAGASFPRLKKFVNTAADTAKAASAKASSVVASGASTTTAPGNKDGNNRFPRLKSLWGTSNLAENPQTPDVITFESTPPATQEEETGPSRNQISNPVVDAAVNGNSTSLTAASQGVTKATNESCSSKKVSSSNRRILPRIQNLLDDRERRMMAATPCLICANPVCSEHESSSFRKEGITLCQNCERLFALDFIVECVSNPDAAERARTIDYMIDCYDRCLLLLKYSTIQYADAICASLESQKEQQNKIGLGSSGVGALSGVLGIAAAATILTPVGPPLLIASLALGGGATAVQTGTEAYNAYYQANPLADRILAWHGMLLSILRVTSTLRDAMVMLDPIRTDASILEAVEATKGTSSHKVLESKAGVLAASNMGRAATLGSVAAGSEAAAAAGVASVSGVATAEAAAATGARGATALSRAGTAAARTVRFARFAGGALSAAVLLMEANSIQSTLKEIQNGSPCAKADKIREIAKVVENEELPSTEELDEECQAYLAALANRAPALPEVAAEALTDAETFPHEIPIAECAIGGGATLPVAAMAASAGTAAESVPLSPSSSVMGGTLILDGNETQYSTMPATSAVQTSTATLVTSPQAQQSRSLLGSSLGSSLMQARSLFQQGHQAQAQRRPSPHADEIVAVAVESSSDPHDPRDPELSLIL